MKLFIGFTTYGEFDDNEEKVYCEAENITQAWNKLRPPFDSTVTLIDVQEVTE